jgi:hypothetical protein
LCRISITGASRIRMRVPVRRVRTHIFGFVAYVGSR